MDRFAASFTSQPGGQLWGGGGDEAALVANWHTVFRPTLGDRYWLPEERRDLLPAFENLGLRIRLGRIRLFVR